MADKLYEIRLTDYLSEHPEVQLLTEKKELINLAREYSLSQQDFIEIYPVNFKDKSVAFFEAIPNSNIGLSPLFVEEQLGISPEYTPSGNEIVNFSAIRKGLKQFYSDYEDIIEESITR